MISFNIREYYENLREMVEDKDDFCVEDWNYVGHRLLLGDMGLVSDDLVKCLERVVSHAAQVLEDKGCRVRRVCNLVDRCVFLT